MMICPRWVATLAQPIGIDDNASGEAISPDFFWESATKISLADGRSKCGSRSRRFATRMRIPRPRAVLLYRNYPRDRNYQFSSAKIPRGYNCFVCRANTLEGLQRLPAGGHLVAAPYVEDEGGGSVVLPLRTQYGHNPARFGNGDQAVAVSDPATLEGLTQFPVLDVRRVAANVWKNRRCRIGCA